MGSIVRTMGARRTAAGRVGVAPVEVRTGLGEGVRHRLGEVLLAGVEVVGSRAFDTPARSATLRMLTFSKPMSAITSQAAY